MKKSLYIILLLFPLLLSCQKEEGAVDTTLKASLWAQDEESATFTMKGKTLSGNDSYRAVVTFVSGKEVGGIDWTPVIQGSPSWASVEKIKIRKDFDGTYPGEDMEVWYDGISITVEPNLERARRFNLLISTSAGQEFVFPFLQEGLQNNPAIMYEGEDVEILFVPEQIAIPFETNTPVEEISCDIEYDDVAQDWLSVLKIEADHLVIEASQNEDESFDRSAILTLTAGSQTTVQAQTQVVVKQLRKADYWFVYGNGINDGILAGDGVMLETSGNSAGMTAWFEGEEGIFLTHNSKKAGFPYYALAADGTVVEIADESSPLPQPPVMDIDGMKNLRFDTSAMTWTFERVSTPNCCPDSEVGNYPQKDYPTEAGGYKTWMTVSLHWDGGSDLSPYKLGSGLVNGRTTGGYGEAASYDSRNPQYDTRENGGVIEEVPGLAEKWGRLYSIYEALTGVPGGALSPAYVVNYPLENPFTDAVGRKYTNSVLTHASVQAAGDDASVEQTYPAVMAQVQGLCPYGWHIATLQDWKDLMWAASQTDGAITDVTYAGIADGTVTGAAPVLLSKEFGEYRTTAKPHSKATEFGFGLFPQGWRLYKTGYDYGPGSGDARFYTFIPLMGNAVSNIWRMQYTGGNDIVINSTLNIGNVSGCAVRCVKNYR